MCVPLQNEELRTDLADKSSALTKTHHTLTERGNNLAQALKTAEVENRDLKEQILGFENALENKQKSYQDLKIQVCLVALIILMTLPAHC